MHFVFMGVSGSGKSAVAERVAERLALPFAEADIFHTRTSVAKMAAGIPLSDQDRWPWLQELGGWIAVHEALGNSTVMACSSLKRDYRKVLGEAAPGVHFLHLHGPPEVILERLDSRRDHFMPPELLDSQLAALQPLAVDEAGQELDIRMDLDELIEQALGYVGKHL